MKRILLLSLAAVAIFTSCEDDPPEPNFDLRDDYLGTWLVQENSGIFGNQSYAVEVSKSDTAETGIWVSNFYGLGTSAITVMNVVDNNIVIPLQTVAGSDLSGTGKSDREVTSVELTYGVNDGSGVDNCTASWRR